MQQIIDFIEQMLTGNIIFNTVTLILAILGIFLAILFYFKSIKRKRPVYLSRTFTLISESFKKVPSLSIKHSNDDINNLSITRIAFWNDGKDTIDINDIAKNNPIKFVIDEKYDILDAEILYHKNKSNDFKIIPNKKEIKIDFDYIDNKEGVILQIYHTGNSNKDFTVQGSIKSVKDIICKNNIPLMIKFAFWVQEKCDKNKLRKYSQYVYGSLILIISILLPLYYLSQFHPLLKEMLIDKEFSYITFIILLIFSLMYMKTGLRIFKKPIPDGFEIFYDEI